jgi:RNA polymerase sigma-70 factor (ECF subfamily)
MSPTPASALANVAEALLVVAARTGDRAAFAELVRRRQNQLRGLLRRLCRDASLAEDLAQETFLQVWKQLHNLRAAGAFGGWLRRIAVTTWLQHARRAEPFSELADEDEGATPTTSEQLDLNAALALLPAAPRLCIVLAYHESMSHGEIATLTGLPLGTVKSHIARGTTRLRALLAAYDERPVSLVKHA